MLSCWRSSEQRQSLHWSSFQVGRDIGQNCSSGGTGTEMYFIFVNNYIQKEEMFDFVLGLNIFICGDGQQLENDIRIEQTVWMFHVNTFMISSYFNDLHMIYNDIYSNKIVFSSSLFNSWTEEWWIHVTRTIDSYVMKLNVQIDLTSSYVCVSSSRMSMS